MDVHEYVKVLKKNWILVLLSTVLGLGAGAGFSLFVTPKYESTTQMYFAVRSEYGGTGELVSGTDYATQILNSYVDVIQTGSVLGPVIEGLQLDMTADELSLHVWAEVPPNSVLMNITAQSPSPEQAAAIATAVSDSFTDLVRDQLQPGVVLSDDPVNLTVTQPALVPEDPVSPNVLVNLLVGLALGLALGYGIALLLKVTDTRLYSSRDVKQLTEKAVIGEISVIPGLKKDRLIVNSRPWSASAESFRALRTNLQFLRINAQKHSYVITSPKPSEGKTTTTLNLALAIAQTGARVAVVEGDLRMPKFGDYLGIEGSGGLTDVLIGKADLDDVLQRWGKHELYVLPAGRVPPNPSELLGSSEMQATVKQLEGEFDYVLIDAPPTLAVTDAAVLGKRTAGLLMIVSSGSTTQQELEAALSAAENAGTKVLGVVMTMLPNTGVNASGYIKYGYHDQAQLEASGSHRQLGETATEAQTVDAPIGQR